MNRKALKAVRCFISAAVGALSCVGGNVGHAQVPPLPKVVRIVAPFGPGGGSDTVARSAAQWIQKQTGNSAIVENRPGANGNLAAAHVATAPNDGSTLLLGNLGLITHNQYLYRSLAFNPQHFVPIAHAGETTVLVKTGGTKPYVSVQQLASAGQDPKRLSYGSWGYGSVSHVAAELLFKTIGMGAVHVPFRGGAADTNAALLSGTLDFMVDPFFPSPGQNIRVLAVMAHKRAERFPDVPTLAELGYRSVDATSWVGFFAPRGTSPAVIRTLNELINGAWRDPEINARVSKVGFNMKTLTVSEFSEMIRESDRLWGPLLKELNIKID